MDFISTLLIAIALAMDAFSVSLTKGFTLQKPSLMVCNILWRIPGIDACFRLVRWNST